MKSILSSILIFVSIIILSTSCAALKAKKKAKNSVFSINAIQANQEYYTKAVLEHRLVNAVIEKYGEKKQGHQTIYASDIYDDPIVNCNYSIPDSLDDLNSGFQYRYYLFTGETKSAMQAFGITDVSADFETQYLIIDYIQFKDCKCSGIPNTRYAVGLRSELRISKMNIKSDFNGVGSLASLAANVELGNAEVSFSLKTIGITGAKAREIIPGGVSFDVTTYKDFQNAIDFLKSDISDTIDVIISPEIIPIMDEYRPNTEESLSSLSSGIETFYKKIKKIKKWKLGADAGAKMKKIYEAEIERLLNEREALANIQNQLYSFTEYELILETIKNSARTKIMAYYTSLSNEIIESTDWEFINKDEHPNLVKLDVKKRNILDSTFLYSDDISYFEYELFLAEFNSMQPSEDDLEFVIEEMKKSDNPNDFLLRNIISKLLMKED